MIFLFHDNPTQECFDHCSYLLWTCHGRWVGDGNWRLLSKLLVEKLQLKKHRLLLEEQGVRTFFRGNASRRNGLWLGATLTWWPVLVILEFSHLGEKERKKEREGGREREDKEEEENEEEEEEEEGDRERESERRWVDEWRFLPFSPPPL